MLNELLGMPPPAEEVVEEPVKDKKLSPFDFINAITSTKEDLFADDPERISKQYNAYIVNHGLSYYSDTVLFANELNTRGGSNIPASVQFKFYIEAIRKKKRFEKWHKKPPETEDMALIKEHYAVNDDRAIEYLSMMPEEEIERIRSLHFKGGAMRKRR